MQNGPQQTAYGPQQVPVITGFNCSRTSYSDSHHPVNCNEVTNTKVKEVERMQLFVVEDMFKIELDSYLRHLYPEVTLQNSLGILQLFQEVGHFSVGWVRNSPSTCNQVVFNSGLPHHKGLKEDQTCLCSRKTSGFNR